MGTPVRQRGGVGGDAENGGASLASKRLHRLARSDGWLWITQNFMGFFSDFDHWQVGDHLDFAAWDSYPTGFAEHFPFGDPERQRWQDTSHADIAPFHHDLFRGVGRGRFWVMEQQPGPVNWAGTLRRRAAWSACGRSKRTRTAPTL